MASRIIRLPGVRATKLGNERNVWVYLPSGYDERPELRYPVLYMHVGQLVFSSGEPSVPAWEMGRTLDRLIADGRMREILLVAVEHKPAAGANEYLHELSAYPVRCDGEDYEFFLAEELKPLIDRTFRTRPEPEHTALMGSSAAGLATYNIGLRRPETFGLLGILSPFFVRADPATLEETVQYRFRELGPRQKAWIDIGGAEGFFMPKHVRPVAEAWLRGGAKQGEQVAYLEEPGAAHSEKDWGERADKPLLFFFGRGGTPAPVRAELHGPTTVGLEGPEAYLNAIVTYENGFSLSDLEGRYEADRPDRLRVAPNGLLIPLSEGEATVAYSKDGVTARHRLEIVPSLTETVAVTVEAIVPETTEPDARVYATFELERLGDRLYGTTIALPRGMTLDFHLTRGYGRNEGDAHYRPIPLRRLTADADKTVRYEAESWLDQAPDMTEERRKGMVW